MQTYGNLCANAPSAVVVWKGEVKATNMFPRDNEKS